MSRNRYILAYDISDKKRLRDIYKKATGYGDPLQLSVFICDLSPTELLLMENDLSNVMNLKEDSVIIANLGPVTQHGSKRIKAIGRPLDLEPIRAIIL